MIWRRFNTGLYTYILGLNNTACCELKRNNHRSALSLKQTKKMQCKSYYYLYTHTHSHIHTRTHARTHSHKMSWKSWAVLQVHLRCVTSGVLVVSFFNLTPDGLVIARLSGPVRKLDLLVSICYRSSLAKPFHLLKLLTAWVFVHCELYEGKLTCGLQFDLDRIVIFVCGIYFIGKS